MPPEARDIYFLKNVQTGPGLTHTPVEWAPKSTTRTNCVCAVYLLMMGYKYARNM